MRVLLAVSRKQLVLLAEFLLELLELKGLDLLAVRLQQRQQQSAQPRVRREAELRHRWDERAAACEPLQHAVEVTSVAEVGQAASLHCRL
eukprot:scaffold97819_cov57-Phaeocystis_antarctica.AAC.1